RPRPWVLSLQLQRQRGGLCRRDGAGGAGGHAGGGRARPRRLPQGLLRQARPDVSDLRPVDRGRCPDPDHHPDPARRRARLAMISNLLSPNPRPSRTRVAALTALVLAFAMVSPASAQQSFKSPEEAVDALVSAAKSRDRRTVLTVLGPDAAD